MFLLPAALRRSLRCAGCLFASIVAIILSLTPWFPAAAQDAAVNLPAISVTVPPPSRATNQASGDAVVVSPTTTVTPSDQSASSVTVITAIDIEIRQLRTVPDALATVPGLNVVQTGGPGGLTSVFIRGTNSNHVKVLIDGIDVTDPSSPNDAFDFGQLLTGDIARIEVLRGPQSGLYGSDAIGGVIAITTKDGSGPPKFTASMEGGSFGTTNERASLSGSQADFNYAFNVQHYQAASTPVTPPNLLAPGEQRINDFYDNWTVSTKLGAKLTDTLAANLVGRYTDSKLLYTGEDCVNFFPCAPEMFQNDQVDHQFFGRAELVWSPVAGFKNFFGVNYSNLWSYYADPNPDNYYVPIVVPPSTSLGTRVKYDYRSEWQVAPGQLLVVGAEDQNETLRTNSTSSVDPTFTYQTFFTTNAERRSDAGWLELQNQLTRQFYLVSNIRYDAYEDFGGHTTWRLAPVYIVPGADTKIKATYGTGFKAPTLNQLYVSYPPTYIANPNLKPEESKGWDVGFEQPLATDRFRFGATYFRNDIKNLIDTGLASPGVYTSVNFGAASMFGAETFAAWSVTSRLNLRADYTYTVAKNDSTLSGCPDVTPDCAGQQLLRRPKNKASLIATWKPIDRLSVSSSLLYVGSWWDIDRSGYMTGLKSPPYMTVNLATEYAASDTLTYFARIDNLFNRQYEDPLGFLRPGFGVFGGVRLTVGGTPSSGAGSGLASSGAAAPPPGSPTKNGGVM